MLAEVFALAAMGCYITNFDNILLVVSSGGRLHAARSALVFFIMLTLAILAGLFISLGVDTALPSAISWVGLVPVSMGIYELFARSRKADHPPSLQAGSAIALALPLAANSLDTVAVQAALFSDIANRYHAAAIAGAFSAAATLTLLAWYIISVPSAARRLIPLAEKWRPWLLMIIGILILTDTGFDAI